MWNKIQKVCQESSQYWHWYYSKKTVIVKYNLTLRSIDATVVAMEKQ